ncbi:MAG: hypothetical protein WC477_07400 [Patescibacteria group bacterium]
MYVFEFIPLSNEAPPGVNLISSNTVQITSDGEIVGILVDVWDEAQTQDLDFHTSFRLYNNNANVGITKAARQNPQASDYIRFRTWVQGSNQSSNLALLPGSKVAALDEVQINVRLEATAPAAISAIVPSIVLITRENALARART